MGARKLLEKSCIHACPHAQCIQARVNVYNVHILIQAICRHWCTRQGQFHQLSGFLWLVGVTSPVNGGGGVLDNYDPKLFLIWPHPRQDKLIRLKTKRIKKGQWNKPKKEGRVQLWNKLEKFLYEKKKIWIRVFYGAGIRSLKDAHMLQKQRSSIQIRDLGRKGTNRP